MNSRIRYNALLAARVSGCAVADLRAANLAIILLARVRGAQTGHGGCAFVRSGASRRADLSRQLVTKAWALGAQ